MLRNLYGELGKVMKSNVQQLVDEKRNVHILYAFTGDDNYFRELYQFMEDGIRNGEHVLLVENERVANQIQKEVKRKYSTKQLEQIHYVNSLHFYWSSGSYNPPAIQDYFTEMVSPFVESEQPFRSWAHVEWESINEPLHLIEEFETIVDNAVNDLEFPLICAYELKKMPERLQTILLETHPYVLEDELVSESSIYTP